MNDIILAAIVGGLFGLLGAVVGVFGALAVSNRTAKLEEKKHFRELGLKVALTKFEKNGQLAQQLANATGKFQEIPPLEAFVIDGFKFMDIVASSNMDAHTTARRMAELRDFNKIIVHAAKQKA